MENPSISNNFGDRGDFFAGSSGVGSNGICLSGSFFLPFSCKRAVTDSTVTAQCIKV